MSTQTGKTSSPHIGIDFGTTKTLVAEYDPVRQIVKPHKLGRGSFEMPTSIYVTANSDLLYGDEADDEGITDLPNHIRRFKMKLGTPGLAHVGRMPGTAVEITTNFLAHVKEVLKTQVLYTSVERVILTVPAMFGPAQRKDLITAAMQAGFKEVELLAEPVAAGIAYCDHHRELSKHLRFIVVDWGGGTFDAAHVERTASGDLRINEDFVVGLDDIGGEVFDDYIWSMASNALKATGPETLDRQPRSEWGRYRRDLTRAKERLSSHELVNMAFTLEGGQSRKISLTRDDFSIAVRPLIQRAASFVSQILVRAHNAGHAPEFILLAGGTSKIPMVREELERVTGVECRQWTEGREAIALGAAIKAHQVWGLQASLPNFDKLGAMSQYRSLLEGTLLNKRITPEGREFLEGQRKSLGLTIEESHSLQIQVTGGLIDQWASDPKPVTCISTNKSPFQINLGKSPIGLQVKALAPDAHPEIQLDEFLRRTHFCMAYLLHIENVSGSEILSVRLSMTSSEGQQYSILIPSIRPGKAGALSLTTADLEGWMITPGDRIAADASGLEPAIFEATDQVCAAIDNKRALKDDVPCLVFVKKATFSSNFVIRVLNPHPQKITITEFKSPAGNLRSPIQIEPNAEAEIGWCELSESRNLTAGEEFLIKVYGFREVQGVVAEGRLNGGASGRLPQPRLGGYSLPHSEDRGRDWYYTTTAPQLSLN